MPSELFLRFGQHFIAEKVKTKVKMKKNKLLTNTSMLYMMNIAKMVFPLVTLPYLTRVLTTETYGVVAFVKALMQYMQLGIDFGFMLSGTRSIVNAKGDKDALGTAAGNILCAKMLIGGVLLVATLVCAFAFDILKGNVLYTLLSFAVVFLSCFLLDFLFRGIEEMQVIAIQFMIIKGITTLLTFVIVRGDADIFWIPVLDIIGSLLAIVLTIFKVKKRDIRLRISGLRDVFGKIKNSVVYFFSDVSTTAFTALNTLLIGAVCTKTDIAYWSVCMQLVSAVQSMYTPLSDGVYPEMLKSKNIKVIGKVFAIFVPIVAAGCIFTYFVAEIALGIAGGEEYRAAAPVLRMLIPLMLLSFFTIMIGWPILGAINKTKQVTFTTVITAIAQIAGMGILVITNKFTLINVALLRVCTEALLLILRFSFCMKYRRELNCE